MKNIRARRIRRLTGAEIGAWSCGLGRCVQPAQNMLERDLKLRGGHLETQALGICHRCKEAYLKRFPRTEVERDAAQSALGELPLA